MPVSGGEPQILRNRSPSWRAWNRLKVMRKIIHADTYAYETWAYMSWYPKDFYTISFLPCASADKALQKSSGVLVTEEISLSVAHFLYYHQLVWLAFEWVISVHSTSILHTNERVPGQNSRCESCELKTFISTMTFPSTSILNRLPAFCSFLAIFQHRKKAL